MSTMQRAASSIPQVEAKLIEQLSRRLRQHAPGKVRELFDTQTADTLLMFNTSGWSAFDFNLPFPIPGKGRVLNATTISVKRTLEKRFQIPTDLVAYGKRIDDHLPPQLHGQRLLQSQATVVRKFNMLPVEFIIRGNCLGSMARKVEEGRLNATQFVNFCGYDVPTTTSRGQELSEPLVTPTTKAKKGKDVDLDYREVEKLYPGSLAFARKVFLAVRTMLNEQICIPVPGAERQPVKGLLLDMKIEIALDPATNDYVLCDEVSPDSCRFVLAEDYPRLCAGEDVDFYDKEYGRKWLQDKVGLNKLDPLNPEHLTIAAEIEPNDYLITELRRRYEVACTMLTCGSTSGEFVHEALGIGGQ